MGIRAPASVRGAVGGFASAVGSLVFCLWAFAAPPPAPRPPEDGRSLAPSELLRPGSDLLLVDVRPAREFQSLRIPGSLNVPPFAVKAKRAWSEKRVVLLGGGFDSEDLEVLGDELRRAGFREVLAFPGGLVRWAALGGPLLGDPADLVALRRVPPRLLSLQEEREDLLVVWLGLEAGSGEGPFRRSLAVSPASDRAWLGRLERALEGSDRPSHLTLLFVDRDGTSYGKVADDLKANRLEERRATTAFFLQGGLEAYEQHRRERERASRGSGRRGLSACGACP